MRLGVHMRIGKGLIAALDEAQRLGCEAMQIFAGNPNAWKETFVPPAIAEAFCNDKRRARIRPIILHTPYLLNLATPDELIYGRSVQALIAALNRATALQVEYVVTHIGSHSGHGYNGGIERIGLAVTTALAASPGDHMLLLEGGSGAGNTIGSRFEQLADILAGLGGAGNRVGIALDTAHLWGAGYDLSNQRAVEQVLMEFDDKVGLSRLRLMHLNDTQVALGCHRDRHWHIGYGNIGTDGFRALVNHPALVDLAGILETPMVEDWDQRNMATLKALRIGAERVEQNSNSGC